MEKGRKKRMRMRKEIRVMKEDLGHANRIAASSARRDVRVFLLLLLPDNSPFYRSLETVYREKLFNLIVLDHQLGYSTFLQVVRSA